MMEIAFRARIWLYEGQAAWYFVTLPKGPSAEIKSMTAGRLKTWGSVPVTAMIGSTRWKTSIFRDTKRAAYLLPLKAAVRTKEQLRAGDSVEISLLIDAG